jgi:glycine cleavage system aminomethyltransferase T
MEVRRIEAGILDNITDFDVTMNPFQAGLGPFIDIEKESFIGRDTLLKVDKSVLMLGLKCVASEPAYRGKVFDDSKKVGHVSAVTWLPTLDCLF